MTIGIVFRAFLASFLLISLLLFVSGCARKEPPMDWKALTDYLKETETPDG